MITRSVFIGFFYAVIATILWSGNFIVARGLNEEIAPLALAFWRWVVAILVLFPFAIHSLMANKAWLKEHFGYFSVVSLLGVTLFNSFIYYAGKTSSAINLSLIAITFPIFILILSRLFWSEKIGWNKLVGIVLVAFGIVLLISKGDVSVIANLSFSYGDIWILAASLIFAVYSMLLKRKPKGLGVSAFQLASFILGLIFLLPFYLLELYWFPSKPIETSTVISILYIGIFASLFAFILWNKAIEVLGAVNAGMVYYSLPIFSGLLAVVLLDEIITSLHVYSAIFILSGILVAVIYKPKMNQNVQ